MTYEKIFDKLDRVYEHAIKDGNFNKILRDCFNVLKATKNLYQEVEY